MVRRTRAKCYVTNGRAGGESSVHGGVMCSVRSGVRERASGAREATVGAGFKLLRARPQTLAESTHLPVVILLHVKRLEARRVIRHDSRLLKDLLREVALVFRAEIDAPEWRLLEGAGSHVLRLEQQGNGVGVRDALERRGKDVVEARDEALLHVGVEEVEVRLAVLQRVAARRRCGGSRHERVGVSACAHARIDEQKH